SETRHCGSCCRALVGERRRCRSRAQRKFHNRDILSPPTAWLVLRCSSVTQPTTRGSPRASRRFTSATQWPGGTPGAPAILAPSAPQVVARTAGEGVKQDAKRRV